jgi:hypothetical protein
MVDRNNPFGQFQSMTPQTQNQMRNNLNNFNQSFQRNSPLIEHANFKNQNNVLHNNMDKKLLSESINDYTLHIDGGDRDTSFFANHFKFTVTFDPSSRQTIGETTFEGHPTPHINRKFVNIKYAKISGILIPKSNVIIPDGGGGFEMSTVAADDISYNTRFLLLRIKELKHNKIYSTNNKVNDQTIFLYKDHDMGANFQLWSVRDDPYIFTNANLKNLNRLTFELLNDQGELITIAGIDPAVTDITDVRHLRNKFTQLTIQMILGVVENELNVDTKFSR